MKVVYLYSHNAWIDLQDPENIEISIQKSKQMRFHVDYQIEGVQESLENFIKGELIPSAIAVLQHSIQVRWQKLSVIWAQNLM